jgi:hypothetical protein
MNRTALDASYTVTFALFLVVADKGAYCGERIVLKEHPAGLIQLACLEQLDDLRDGGVDGTALLALGIFAAQAAVGFVHNVKCHISSSLF